MTISEVNYVNIHEPTEISEQYCVARETGAEVILSDSNLILVDWDSPKFEDCELSLSERLGWISRIFGDDLEVTLVDSWRSKSGNWHLKLRSSRDLEPLERLLIEVALGSDIKRALHGLARLWAGNKDCDCSVLFRYPTVSTVTDDEDDLPF